VDVSRRHPASRQLAMETDAAAIADYRNPAYVLGGWFPKMAPLILSQPEPATATPGQTAVFHIKVAAVPEPGFQWYRNGKPVKNATSSSLIIENTGIPDEGIYTVKVGNDSGSITSNGAALKVMK